MNSHFEDIMTKKLGDLLAQRLQESALEGLDPEIQVKAKSAMLVFQLEHQFHQLKLTDTVKPAPWLDALNEEEKQQVIAYFASCPLDEDNRNALNWYEREQRFRVERIIHPALSR